MIKIDMYTDSIYKSKKVKSINLLILLRGLIGTPKMVLLQEKVKLVHMVDQDVGTVNSIFRVPLQ